MLRYIHIPDFTGIIFRKNNTHIIAPGGLWDASQKIYRLIPGAIPRKNPFRWIFPSGATITFAHVERDDDAYNWQGSELAVLAFDELTHFTEFVFFYMYSRNRTTCGIRPRIVASCNPDSESWVARFISWWIDQDTGYAIPERSGKIRYFARINEEWAWGDTPEEVMAQAPPDNPLNEMDLKTVSFVPSSLQDNKILMENDPGYMANLKAMSIVQRERLLFGNWKIRPAAGLFFKRSQVNMITELPNDVKVWVRGWDLAATAAGDARGTRSGVSTEPAHTAGVLLGKRPNGHYVVADVTDVALNAGDVRSHILNTARADKAKYKRYKVRLPMDPGQAGKEQAESYIKFLAGFAVNAVRETGTKESRAEPFAAQWQNGNVEVMEGPWNEKYFQQLESFPDAKLKDMVDASSAAFNEIEHLNVTVKAPKATTLGKESYWRK